MIAHTKLFLEARWSNCGVFNEKCPVPSPRSLCLNTGPQVVPLERFQWGALLKEVRHWRPVFRNKGFSLLAISSLDFLLAV